MYDHDKEQLKYHICTFIDSFDTSNFEGEFKDDNFETLWSELEKYVIAKREENRIVRNSLKRQAAFAELQQIDFINLLQEEDDVSE